MTKIDNVSVAHNRLFAPQLVALVTSVDKNGKVNVAPFAWVSTASKDPALVTVSIAPSRYSHECITHSGEFVLNLPGMDMAEVVNFCGTCSGRDVDKIAESGLNVIDSLKVTPPRIEECATHLECKVVDSLTTGDHTVFVGEVMAMSCDDDVLLEGGLLDVVRVKPLMHIGGPNYATVGETRRA